jgi:hypothetical protein
MTDSLKNFLFPINGFQLNAFRGLTVKITCILVISPYERTMVKLHLFLGVEVLKICMLNILGDFICFILFISLFHFTFKVNYFGRLGHT